MRVIIKLIKSKQDKHSNMERLFSKLIIAIAVGILVGTVIGGMEKNQKVEYYFINDTTQEVSEDFYKRLNEDSDMKWREKVFKKTTFNKDLAFYYGAITGATLMILLLIPYLIKNKK